MIFTTQEYSLKRRWTPECHEKLDSLFFHFLFFFCYLFLDPPGGMSKQKKSLHTFTPIWWTGRDLNPRPFGHPRQNAYANRTFYGPSIYCLVYQAELPAPKTCIPQTHLKTLASNRPYQIPENVNTRPSPSRKNQWARSSARLCCKKQR